MYPMKCNDNKIYFSNLSLKVFLALNRLMAEFFSIQSICDMKVNLLLTIFNCTISGFEHLLYSIVHCLLVV